MKRLCWAIHWLFKFNVSLTPCNELTPIRPRIPSTQPYSCQKDMTDTTDGYDDGHDDGYDDGYDEGYDEGYDYPPVAGRPPAGRGGRPAADPYAVVAG